MRKLSLIELFKCLKLSGDNLTRTPTSLFAGNNTKMPKKSFSGFASFDPSNSSNDDRLERLKEKNDAKAVSIKSSHDDSSVKPIGVWMDDEGKLHIELENAGMRQRQPRDERDYSTKNAIFSGVPTLDKKDLHFVEIIKKEKLKQKKKV